MPILEAKTIIAMRVVWESLENEEDKRTMEVSGNQKVKAVRPQVFNALLDPETLKNSVPGCDGAEFVDFPTGRQLKLTVSPNFPGFKGPYNVFLQTGAVNPPSHLVLIAEPTSSLGSIKATCSIAGRLSRRHRHHLQRAGRNRGQNRLNARFYYP